MKESVSIIQTFYKEIFPIAWESLKRPEEFSQLTENMKIQIVHEKIKEGCKTILLPVNDSNFDFSSFLALQLLSINTISSPQLKKEVERIYAPLESMHAELVKLHLLPEERDILLNAAFGSL